MRLELARLSLFGSSIVLGGGSSSGLGMKYLHLLRAILKFTLAPYYNCSDQEHPSTKSTRPPSFTDVNGIGTDICKTLCNSRVPRGLRLLQSFLKAGTDNLFGTAVV